MIWDILIVFMVALFFYTFGYVMGVKCVRNQIDAMFHHDPTNDND